MTDYNTDHAARPSARKLVEELEAGRPFATHYRIDNDGTRTIVKPCSEIEPVVFGDDPVLGMTPQEFAAHVLHTTTIDRVREVAYCLEADHAAQLFEILDDASRAIFGETEAKS